MKVFFLMFFISQWKNIMSRDLEATPMGEATSKAAQWRCLFTLVVVTLVAYRHDVRRENLTFWLFQNCVKSDLMLNNMKINGDMRN